MHGLSIGDVARQTGVAVSAIRYYEERGLLPQALRHPNNRRSYGSEIVDALQFISACRSNGMGIDAILELQQNLYVPGQTCIEAARILRRTISELTKQIADLQAARRHLSKVVGACSPANCSPECTVPDSMRVPSVG